MHLRENLNDFTSSAYIVVKHARIYISIRFYFVFIFVQNLFLNTRNVYVKSVAYPQISTSSPCL